MVEGYVAMGERAVHGVFFFDPAADDVVVGNKNRLCMADECRRLLGRIMRWSSMDLIRTRRRGWPWSDHSLRLVYQARSNENATFTLPMVPDPIPCQVIPMRT